MDRTQDDFTVESSRVDQRIHLLLADDHQDFSDYVVGLLRRWWSIEAVSDGAAAMAAIRRRRPTLVLADAAMQGQNGTRWDPLESTCRHASLSIL